MSNRTDIAAQFTSHVRGKRFGEAAAMLAEDIVMTVPQVGPIQGRAGVEAALRMASESGRGLERIGWSAPSDERDGIVRVAGKAPGGLLGIIAKLLRKQVAVTITCGFSEGDEINKLDVVTA